MILEYYQVKIGLNKIPVNPNDRLKYCTDKIRNYHRKLGIKNKKVEQHDECIYGLGIISLPIISLILLFKLYSVYNNEMEKVDFFYLIGLVLICGLAWFGNIKGKFQPFIFATKLRKLSQPAAISKFNTRVLNRDLKEIQKKHILAGLISTDVALKYNQILKSFETEREWIQFRDQELCPDLVVITS